MTIISIAYVEQLLRQKDVSGLSAEERIQRSEMLDPAARVPEGRRVSVQPRSPGGGRRPCFIDRDGNICAVGYLLEQSAGRAGRADQCKVPVRLYRRLGPCLNWDWVAGSGLSLERGGHDTTNLWVLPTCKAISNLHGISRFAGWVNMSLSVLEQHSNDQRKFLLALGILGVAGGRGGSSMDS